MSDVSGAAAPAEVSAPELPLDTPNPVSTEDQGHPEPDAKPEGKPDKATETKPLSAREALEKAAKTVEKETAEVKTEAKPDKPADKSTDKPAKTEPEVKTEPKRDETGKFASDKPVEAKVAAPKPAGGLSPPAEETPKWIKSHEKAAWSTMAPEQRAIAERRDREATEGFEKYRSAAERDASLNEFHEMAKQSGKDLRTVVGEYVNMENHLRKDLVGGLDTICQRMGVSLKDVAAHVMGQTPEQNASAQDATIRELKAEIAELKSSVGNVAQTFQQQQSAAVGKEVQAFAAAHPRFDELHEDIAFFLKTRTKDLAEAYKLAELLNPAPAAPAQTAASTAPVIDLSAQTEKGQKSIAGSPGPGSNSAAHKPSSSIKESLRRAMAQAG